MSLKQIPSYLYKIGHCQQLSLAELEFSQIKIEKIELSKKLIYSNQDIDIQKLGGTVFKAQKIDSIPGDLGKRIGIIVNKTETHSYIKSFKAKGAKKINALDKLQKFNIGHYKQTKSWFYIEDQTIWQITDYTDQEYWNQIDQILPHSEMSRGLINFKLARSLLNLTKNKNIWDPMAGVGRVAIAGWDLKNQWIMSDKDDLEIEIKENLSTFEEYINAQTPENVQVIRPSTLITTQDLTKKIKQDLVDTKISKFSVVSEGWLGQNFKKIPSQTEIQREFESVFATWQKALNNLASLKVKEVIFCLPYYIANNKTIIPDSFIDNLIKNSAYKIEPLRSKNYILYSRPKTITGHLILKLVL